MYDINCYPIHYDGGNVKICQRRASRSGYQSFFENSNCFKEMPCNDCKCVRNKHICYYYFYDRCPKHDQIDCEFGCRHKTCLNRPCILKNKYGI